MNFEKRTIFDWVSQLGSFSKLIKIRFKSKKIDIIDSSSKWFGDAVNNLINCTVLGPEFPLISKINKALRKIEDGTYGYCEETNQPISLKRLIARPIATLSLEAQESHEKSEKIYKEKEY